MARKVSRKDRQEIEARKEQIRFLLSDRRGRDFLWWLLSITRVYWPTYVEGDAHATSFREGKRDIGLQALRRIHEGDAGAYVQMLQEHPAEDVETGTNGDDGYGDDNE